MSDKQVRNAFAVIATLTDGAEEMVAIRNDLDSAEWLANLHQQFYENTTVSICLVEIRQGETVKELD